MRSCWSVNFARSQDTKRKGLGLDVIGYRTSGCGTYLLRILISKDYSSDEMACRTYSEGRREQSSLRCKSVETLELGAP